MRRVDALVVSDAVGRYVPNERGLLVTNRLTPRDGTRRGVVWCHGATADASAVMFHPPAVELAKRGFVVLGIDAGGIHTWANDAGLAAVTAAVAWLRGAGGASADPVVLSGGSMGSTLALTWAANHPADVAAVEVALPIPDIEAVRAADRQAFAAPIAAAYGTLAGWQAARAARNPLARAADLTMPVRLDYSTTDTIGLPAETLAFAAALPDATAVPFGAAGHTYGGFGADDAADWIESVL